ncbi:MAG: hypothetical protein ACEPOW_07820 [Bacteroidales bacterium]
MKKLSTAIALLLFCFALTSKLTAQQKISSIEFEQIINLHKNLSEDQKALKALIPEFAKSKLEIIYNNKQAKLRKGKAESNSNVMISMNSGSNGEQFFDLQNKKIKNFIRIDGEDFFYTEDIKIAKDFTPTGKTKEILGYKCKELKNNEEGETLYITNDLPNFLSPLPEITVEGTILEADLKKIQFKATKINKDQTTTENVFATPKAREITKDQYNDLQEEKLNEMINMPGAKVIRN